MCVVYCVSIMSTKLFLKNRPVLTAQRCRRQPLNYPRLRKTPKGPT